MPRSQIPEVDLHKIRAYCDARIPAHVRDQVRLEVEVRGNNATIYERRPPWHPTVGPVWSTMPIARLRWSATHSVWTLFWADSNGTWHRYLNRESTPTITVLLDELDRDPTGTFWG